jgi:hypothetical protein
VNQTPQVPLYLYALHACLWTYGCVLDDGLLRDLPRILKLDCRRVEHAPEDLPREQQATSTVHACT